MRNKFKVIVSLGLLVGFANASGGYGGFIVKSGNYNINLESTGYNNSYTCRQIAGNYTDNIIQPNSEVSCTMESVAGNNIYITPSIHNEKVQDCQLTSSRDQAEVYISNICTLANHTPDALYIQDNMLVIDYSKIIE